jgi:3-isopropylmalate dehydratase small subunit
VLVAELAASNIADGEEIEVDLRSGDIKRADGSILKGKPFSQVQLEIYQRGGLLVA